MENNNSALILEGGGMRGAYVTGVLDFFLKITLNLMLVTAFLLGQVMLVRFFLSKQVEQSELI